MGSGMHIVDATGTRRKAARARGGKPAPAPRSSAVAAEITGLDWVPVGPAPDPEVAIEAWVTLNGIAFRLLGLRVKRPYLAGWSQGSDHEITPCNSQGQLLFDKTAYLDWLRRWDAYVGQPDSDAVDDDTLIEPDAPHTPEAQVWARAYERVHRGDLTDFSHMMLRNGAPHYLLGLPTNAAPRGPAFTIAPLFRPDPWRGYLSAYCADIPLRIEGVPCAFQGIHVARTDAGWVPKAREVGLDDHDDWIGAWFLPLFGGAPFHADPVALPADGCHLFGWIIPDSE